MPTMEWKRRQRQVPSLDLIATTRTIWIQLLLLMHINFVVKVIPLSCWSNSFQSSSSIMQGCLDLDCHSSWIGILCLLYQRHFLGVCRSPLVSSIPSLPWPSSGLSSSQLFLSQRFIVDDSLLFLDLSLYVHRSYSLFSKDRYEFPCKSFLHPSIHHLA